MTWQTIRTLTTQAAEGTSAPSAGTFVGFTDPRAASFALDGGRVPFIEIGFDSLSLGGSPTAVTFGVWRLSEGKIDRMGSITVAAGDLANAPPASFDFNGEAFWLTVESFAGGSTPNVSGMLRVRPMRAIAQRWSDKNILPTADRTPLPTVATGATQALSTSAAQGSSVAATRRIWVTFDLGQQGIVYVGKDNTVSSAGANAIDALYPGDRLPFEYDNASRLWFVASAGTPSIRIRGE